MSNFKKNALLIVTCLLVASSVAFAMKINGQLESAIIERLAADPTGTGAIEGRVYWNTVDDSLRVYDGAAFVSMADTGSAVANPMDSAGDMIYGAAAGVVTKLDSGTSGQHLVSGGAAVPVWTGLASANFWLGNVSSIPTAVSMTGDVTMTNAGVTAIGTSKVTSAMILAGEIVNSDINASAAIEGSKLVAATEAVAGAVSTTTQNIAGTKTFTGSVFVNGSLTAGQNASGSGVVHIQGAASGYTDAALQLEADGAGRGAGVFSYNDTNNTTWFFGNPYSTPDMFVVTRKSGATGFSTDQNASDLTVGVELLGITSGGDFNVAGKIGANSDASPGSYFDVTKDTFSTAGGYAFSGTDTDATPDSTNIISRMRFSGNATATNAYFAIFQDTATIGSISAASATTVAYTTSSDRRLKKNIEDMFDGIERVKRIKPRYFDWIEGGAHDEGFIAQELRDVVPGAVIGTPDGDALTHPMAVDYGKLTPVLVSAVKELIAQNEDMLVRIAQLEKKLKDK